MTAVELLLAGLAAFAAGFVNAIAGGGTLLTFPALIALGLPPIPANTTSTIALCPGYVGAAWAQRKDLVGQGKRVALFVPLTAVTGAAGAYVLLHTGERAFTQIVPWLILLAALLIGFQVPLRKWISAHVSTAYGLTLATVLVMAAGVYGGYFGAGLGVMVIASLAITLSEELPRLTALKQTISLSVNTAAAVMFAVQAPIAWHAAGVMAACALVGGVIGGAFSTRIPAAVLRACIVVLGVGLAVVYFVRG
jgi:uncharacterized protein